VIVLVWTECNGDSPCEPTKTYPTLVKGQKFGMTCCELLNKNTVYRVIYSVILVLL
jgi:hypothetical protein